MTPNYGGPSGTKISGLLFGERTSRRWLLVIRVGADMDI